MSCNMLKVILLSFIAATTISAPTSDQSISINQFSLKLLENVFAYQENLGPDNFAISPLSIWNLFYLLTDASTGETFDQLKQVLRLPDHEGSKDLRSAIDKVFDTSEVKLKRHSAMFIDEELKVHRQFCETATKNQVETYTVDTTNTTKLASDINYFVCLATEGRIKDIVSPDALENLKLLLVEAVYFKANWTNPFDESETREAPFFDHLGKLSGTVNMMFQSAANKLEDSAELEAEMFEMTYGRNKQYSMVIFLPYDGVHLKKVVENLSATPQEKWLAKLSRNNEHISEVECYVPRFKISCKNDMIQPLKYMGLIDIFDETKSQLPGISNMGMFVSKTIQSVDLTVNEGGTEVAAGTVLGISTRFSSRVDVNRPFAYVILDKKSNIVLFSGVYIKPSVIR